MLENARSVEVDKLVQMDALEPAKKLSPFGWSARMMLAQKLIAVFTLPGTKSCLSQSGAHSKELGFAVSTVVAMSSRRSVNDSSNGKSLRS